MLKIEVCQLGGLTSPDVVQLLIPALLVHNVFNLTTNASSLTTALYS